MWSSTNIAFGAFRSVPEPSNRVAHFAVDEGMANVQNDRLSGDADRQIIVQHTHGHRNCPACMPKGTMRAEVLAKLTFREAKEYWWTIKKPTLSGKTVENYEWYMRSLEQCAWWDRPMENFEWPDLDGYRRRRTETPQGRLERGVSASLANHEIDCVLKPMLKMAGLWHKFAFVYKRLPAMPKKRRFLTFEEEQFFFEVASQQADWRVAYLTASLMNNTGATKLETRHIRMQDIDFENGELHLETVKPNCPARRRTVGLNATAMKQLQRLVEIAINFKGVSKPWHYLFPFRENRSKWNPEVPGSTSFIRAQLEDLRSFVYQRWCEKFKGDKKKCEQGKVFLHLAPHMLRHQFCTNSDEAGVPEAVLCATMGWTSGEMLRIYRHIREDRQVAVGDRLEEWREAKRRELMSEPVIRSPKKYGARA